GGSAGMGMARVSAFTMQATTNITDTPLGYTPPVGPAIGFMINYNYLEANQPSTFTFTNLGPDWSLYWVSYLTVDGSSNVTVRLCGGGSEYYPYTGNPTTPYYPNVLSQATLTSPSSGVYNLQYPDGSTRVFNQSDGSGRIFMTQFADPQ